MEKRKHHYIPKYYLRGFESKEGEFLWIYDKNKKIVFPNTAENTGCESDFYSYVKLSGQRDTNTYEDFLANRVESPANSVIRKLRNQEKITSKEKRILAKYMAIMIKRVPMSREMVENLKPNVIKEVAEDIELQFKIIEKINPDLKDKIGERRRQVKNIFEKVKLETPKEVILKAMDTKNSMVEEALYNMNWRFLISKDLNFLTSDNPCFFFKDIGIGNFNSEVSFPISKNMVIFASWRNNIAESYYLVNSNIVKEINRRTIYNATRYVYSPNNEDWIMYIIKKSMIKLNRINL